MNLSKKNKFIVFLLAICCSGYVSYTYLMKPPAGIQSKQVAFTGTAAEVTPIRELDKRKIGSGSKGKLTHELQSLYFDIVKGDNKKYSDWLTYVE